MYVSCLSSPWSYNLSQHPSGVHSITGQERKRLIQKGMVESEVMVTESQSHIEKHISFLDMLQRGERLRIELIKKLHKEN